MGLADTQIDRLACPIGIAQIKGKEPSVIAAAIAAQLLIESERVSVPQTSPATQPV
jgi:xanthine/CO dehydrogenase XdhC/CoxF family maturation factor